MDAKDPAQTLVTGLLPVANNHKFNDTTKDFYQVHVLNVWGGPRLVAFVSENLQGPSATSLKRWQKKQTVRIEPGVTEGNFVQLADTLEIVVATLPGYRKGPVFASGDETQVIKRAD